MLTFMTMHTYIHTHIHMYANTYIQPYKHHTSPYPGVRAVWRMYQEVTALMEHTSLSAETPPDCVSGPSVCVGHKARELILAGDHIPLAPPGP